MKTEKNTEMISGLEFTLLASENVFGGNKLEAVEKTCSICFPSDFARIMSAGFKENSAGDEDAGAWMLLSQAGYGDVCIVKADGSRGVLYADGECGIRPAALLPDDMTPGGGIEGDMTPGGGIEGDMTPGGGIEGDMTPGGGIEGDMTPGGGIEGDMGPGDDIRTDIDGLATVEMGEYPQEAAPKEIASILEREYLAASLKKTGKVYQGIYTEYEYEGEKYIRAQIQSGRFEKGIWIEVSPVKWIADLEEGLLVSRKILLYGIGLGVGNFYDGDFEMTTLYRYLNSTFAEELVPSEIEEETEEEMKERRQEMKRAEERRNPYGFKFGHVTEEDIIRGAIESDVAVFLHGPSSEGKSARVKQIDPTCEIIYLRNATPDSLNGRSVYNQSTGEMIDIPPTWYKKVKAKCEVEPDRLHVVFFDEINNALPSIQGMAFNIVLDREVNGLWKLPDNARVVAAGNDMQDSLAANQIAAPFFNRFAHVYINTTTDKWLKWARENDIHPAIYAYIAYKDGETLRSKYDGEKPNADPRKWEMASRMLYNTGQPEMLRALIGEDITDEFVQFCNQPVITLDRVIAGDYTKREIDELDVAQRYATVMGLTQTEGEHIDKVRAFITELGEEFISVFDSIRARS